MMRRAGRAGRAVAGAAAVGVLLVVGACTDAADSLDTNATEQSVAEAVQPRLGKGVGAAVDVDIDEVRCPSPIPRGEGETVTCRVVLADDAGSVRVLVTPRGDGDQVDVDLVDAVVDPAQVGRQLHDALVAEYGRSFTVDCGVAGVLVAKPGAAISCTATDDAGRRKVTATVVDATGQLSFDLGGAGA